MKIFSTGPWLSFSGWGISLFFLFPVIGMGQTANMNNPAQEPVEYTVEDIQGSNVQVLEKGSAQWAQAQEGETLESGDEIKVGDNSQAVIMLQSDTSVNLSQGTDIKVDQIEDNQKGGFFSRLELLTGQVLANVKKHLDESGSSFEVDAGGVVCGVRGTAFEVNSQGGDVQTLTHEGTVDVKSGDQENLVQAGNAFSFRNGRFSGRRLLDQEEIHRFEKWREHRQLVFEKRRHRLEDIRNGVRKPWIHRHWHRHRHFS